MANAAAVTTAAPPAVSVLMLCYNRAQYMRQAIRSVLAQTFADFEFIIVDNGSQDAAVSAIAQEFAAQDPRITLHRKPENHGVASGRQHALQLACGHYIATIEDDDHWRADKLQKQVAFMQANPNVGLCSCACTLIDAAGQQIGKALLQDHISPPSTSAADIGISSHAGKFHGSGYIARRKTLLQCGGYRRFFQNGDDYDMHYRMQEAAATAAQSDCLLYYRNWQENSASRLEGRLYVIAAELSAFHRRRNLLDPVVQWPHLDFILIRFFHPCNFGRGKDKWRSEWRAAHAFLALGRYIELRRFLRARLPRQKPHILRLYAKILGWSIKLNRLGFWTGLYSPLWTNASSAKPKP